MASLVYALVSAGLLSIVKELNLKYMKKIRMPIPMEIIIVSDARDVPWTLQETAPPSPYSPGHSSPLPEGSSYKAPTR